MVGPDQNGVPVDGHGLAESVARSGVGGRQLGYLDVRGAAVKRAKDVDCARVAVVADGPDHDGAAGDRHGPAEGVARRGITCSQLGHLAVRGAAVGREEDVGRARSRAAVVVAIGSDHDGVAIYGHGGAEGVARRGVGGRQLGQLTVRGAAVGREEDVGRARSRAAVVVAAGPNHNCVAVDRHGGAEEVARRGIGGRQFGHFDVRGATIGRAEDVGSFPIPGSDHDGAAVDRHGVAEVLSLRAI